MSLVLPSAAEKTALDFMLGVTVPGNQTLKLFTNNIAPADTDTAATYTEMSTLGYVAKTLTKTAWVTTAGATGAPASSVQPQQTFTFTAGTLVTVYGYYVIDSTTGLLLWAESFGGGKDIQNAGDQIIIVPTITLSRV
ncbi:MAG: hypothetical protein QFB87_05290 [Patescibacteria group bacterium]|nr:hypothetical protein [Patescibacteria group bacterium]